MKKIRYGIIGTGSMGQDHIESIKHIENAEIVALADPYNASLEKSLEKIGKNSKIEDFQDYRQLLKLHEVDAVVVAVPNYLHHEVTIQSLESGKHVLCEKPMAIDVKTCQEMIDVAEKTGKILQIGLEYRYSRLYKKMHNIISRGDIGQVKMMWCKEFRDPFHKKVGDWIIQDKFSGGSLVEKDCHHFDLFNWMAGSKPKRVVAFGGQDAVYQDGGCNLLMEEGEWSTLKDKDTIVDVIDNAWVIVEYENGVRGCLGLCFFSPYGNDLMEVGVIGNNGKLESSETKLELSVWDRKTPNETKYTIKIDPEIKRLSHRGSVYYEHLSFIDCIRENKKPFANGEVGKWNIIVALAAQQSIKDKRIVEIKGVENHGLS